jgi:hypothetical protein
MTGVLANDVILFAVLGAIAALYTLIALRTSLRDRGYHGPARIRRGGSRGLSLPTSPLRRPA